MSRNPGNICPRCRTRFAAETARCNRDGWRLIVDRSGQLVAGRYLVEAFLGAGGGGASVWKASEIGRDEKLALKLLHATDATAAQRFERGARLALELEHPAIATVHEFGHFGDLMYVVMELLRGETVQDVLQNQRVVPWPTALGWVDQVLGALQAAHEKGIVHRDLKPGNLFVTDAEARPGVRRVKILDFGIARTVEGQREKLSPALEDEDEDVLGREITARHHICGTPEYMAPEQILGAAPFPAMDIYGLGVVLYRLLTGVMPFKGKTRFDLYHCHLTGSVPPFDPTLGVPARLEAAVMTALAKKPEERHPSAHAFREALRAVGGDVLPSLANPTRVALRPGQLDPATPWDIGGPGDTDAHTLQDVGTGGRLDAIVSEQRFQALVGLETDGPTDPVSARPPSGRIGITLALVVVIVCAAVALLVLLGP